MSIEGKGQVMLKKFKDANSNYTSDMNYNMKDDDRFQHVGSKATLKD